MRTQFAEPETFESQLTGDRVGQLGSALEGNGGAILLISRDKQLHRSLQLCANAKGRLVIQAGGAVGTLAVLQALRPVAVLLDLDLPARRAWRVAELLLSEPGCPPVILVTGKTAHFDLRTAVRLGLLVGKDETPSRFLEIVDETLELAEIYCEERNALQRLLVRWLKPAEAGLITDTHGWTRMRQR